MTTILTSEQAVTKLLEKNAILSPQKKSYITEPWADLGKYLEETSSESEYSDVKKYSFINIDSAFS